MRAFSYLGARKLSLQVAAPPLAALMAEAALREHASSREVELTDAPEPQSIPPADAVWDIYRYNTGIWPFLINLLPGMVYWYTKVVCEILILRSMIILIECAA